MRCSNPLYIQLSLFARRLEPVGLGLRAVVRRANRLAVLEGRFGSELRREERAYETAIDAEKAFREQELIWQEEGWIGCGHGYTQSPGDALGGSDLQALLEGPPEPDELREMTRRQEEQRSDPERARQQAGQARLVEAVQAGRLDEVRALLADGIEPGLADSSYQPATECAASRGHVEMVKILVQAKADRDIAMLEAAANGHVDLVRALLKGRRRAKPDAMDLDGTRALMLAAGAGHLDVVELLVEAGADPDWFMRGRDALGLARDAGHEAVAEFLESRSDTSVAALNEKIFQSVGCNRAEDVAGLVARGADPNRPNDRGETLLVLAIRRGYGDPDTVKALLDAGADPNRSDEDGWLPWAVCQAMRSDPITQPTQERIAAHLLAAGARRDGEAIVRLKNAAREGDLAEVERLLGEGAHPDEGPLDISPLQVAASAGHVEVVRLLLEHGADPNRREPEYFSALIHAAYSGHLHVVRLLVEAGADTEAEVKGVGNAADYAAMDGHPEVVGWLEQHGSGKERTLTVRFGRSGGAKLGWKLFREHADIGNGEYSLLFVRAPVDEVSAVLAEQIEGARRFTGIEDEPCRVHRRSWPIYALQLKRSAWTIVVHAMGSLGWGVFDEGRGLAEALATGRGWRVIHASENDTDCESWFRTFDEGGSTITGKPSILGKQDIRLPGFDPHDRVGLKVFGITRRGVVRVDLVERPPEV